MRSGRGVDEQGCLGLVWELSRVGGSGNVRRNGLGGWSHPRVAEICAEIPWGGGWKFAEKHSGVERRLPRPGYVVATAAGKPKAGWGCGRSRG